MGLLCESGQGELIGFDDARELLQEKNLNLGRWLQSVFDGELTPFKLHTTLRFNVGSIRLAQFAFRRDHIQQFVAHISGSEMEQSPTPAEIG
jgi:hypothetical protein